MKHFITNAALCCLFLHSFSLASQSPAEGCEGSLEGLYLHANNVRAYINNSGSLFFDGEQSAFQVPYEPDGQGTIFAQALWLGAFGPGDTLKVAAPTYGAGRGEYDYFPGPLSKSELPGPEDCRSWARVWTVYRHQIEGHHADFTDNGSIDNPDSIILGWPGLGNPHFEALYGFLLPDRPQGLAPFADVNGDGIYTPLEGDYPMIPQSQIIPEQVSWGIFNDGANEHTDSYGTLPLQVEVHLSCWAFNCADNPKLNNTIFSSYKLINRGNSALDSLHMGLWTDFDLGCFVDDYIGSAPGLNMVFAYNTDNIDGWPDDSCPYDLPTYGANPPVQAISILNRPMDYASFHMSANIDWFPPLLQPYRDVEYYSQLTGRFRDGSPMVARGSGFDPDRQGEPITDFAFFDDPNDPMGWSMYTVGFPDGDERIVPSTRIGQLAPGESAVVDVAYSYFREPGANHLENVTAMYAGVEQLRGWYDNQFAGTCNEPLSEVDNPTPIPGITVFPNPSRGRLELRFPGQRIPAIELLDVRGSRVWQGDEGWQEGASLDFAHLPAGVYFLRAGCWVEKVVIGR